VGGSLSRPHEHFPSIFGGPFWKQYPYFLPCLVSSGFSFVAFVITMVFFKEVCNDSYSSNIPIVDEVLIP
jgi:hypothetical protein